MVNLEYDEQSNTLYLSTPYEAADLCRGIPHGRWNKERKAWMYPSTTEVHEALAEAFGADPAFMLQLSCVRAMQTPSNPVASSEKLKISHSPATGGRSSFGPGSYKAPQNFRTFADYTSEDSEDDDDDDWFEEMCWSDKEPQHTADGYDLSGLDLNYEENPQAPDPQPEDEIFCEIPEEESIPPAEIYEAAYKSIKALGSNLELQRDDITPEEFELYSENDNKFFSNAAPEEQTNIPIDRFTRIEIDREELIFRVYTVYENAALCRSVGGGKWDKMERCWKFPFNLEVARKLTQIFPDVKLPENDFSAEIKQAQEQSLQFSNSLDADFKVKGLGGELLPYQRAGVRYATEKKRCFIADEMGLGKTVQALATLQSLQSFPALVICPTVVKLNWQVEAQKWLPNIKVHVIKGGAKKVTNKAVDEFFRSQLVIVNYDVISSHLKGLIERRFQALVLDESHYVKGYKSQRTKAVEELSKNIPVRLALSGTPLLNRPKELISQLKVLGRLEDLGGFQFFTKRYCAARKTRFGLDISGASHLDELNLRLRECCYVRRKKKDVLTELPAKRVSAVRFELDSAARKAYDTALNNLRQFLIEFKNCDDAELEQKLSAERLVQIELLKQVTVDGKFKQACDWIENFLESGEKLVFFCTHAEIIKRLKQAFPNSVVISGETTARQRQEAVEKFQNDPDMPLALLQLKAAGVGITLTAASNVAFLEMGWTPADHAQAEDRVHRYGQHNQVNVYYLIGHDTIDEQIYDLIEAKKRVVDKTSDGGQVKLKRRENRSLVDDLTDKICATLPNLTSGRGRGHRK